jgi:serine/threonine protein phosphatase 1
MDVMRRILAVGDIHGCFDKLTSLLDKIAPDPEEDTLLFIGDYIDRGPQSKEVVDLLIDLAQRQKNIVFLKGNHEQMLLRYLEDGEDTMSFLANGGIATLDSYLRDGPSEGEYPVPNKHLEFFKNLRLYYETDEYIFVHAGLKEKRPLEKQTEWDMLWIRDEFIHSDFDFGKLVVFGHTPFYEPLVLDNKIGIDTGAVYGNKLTCLELPAVKFHSV